MIESVQSMKKGWEEDERNEEEEEEVSEEKQRGEMVVERGSHVALGKGKKKEAKKLKTSLERRKKELSFLLVVTSASSPEWAEEIFKYQESKVVEGFLHAAQIQMFLFATGMRTEEETTLPYFK